MINHIIVPLHLNYERFIKENGAKYSEKELFSELKILLLRTNRFINSAHQLPSLMGRMKYNLRQQINENIDKLVGFGIWKSTTLTAYQNIVDRQKQNPLFSFQLVLMKTDDIQTRPQNSGPIPVYAAMSDVTKLYISDPSYECIFYVRAWLLTECMSRHSLQKWFSSPYCKDISLVGHEYEPGCLSKQVKKKSTSLDTINLHIPRPQSANNELTKKKQADSLDQLTQKYDMRLISNTMGTKITLKNKISKTKPPPSAGPVAAMPLNETEDKNLVIRNSLFTGSVSYRPQSEIVLENPFWNKQKPDWTQIKKRSRSIFNVEQNFIRSRCWQTDYPLHSAAHKGDILQVSPLLDKGYSCIQKDLVGWTPLHYSVWYGHMDIVSLFIRSNVISINTRTDDSLTPLHMAVINGHWEIAGMLLRQPDIDLTLTTSNGEDARMLADRFKHQSILASLKTAVPKATKVPVYLMGNSVKYVILTRGMDTTFQNLKIQMIYILNIPNSCVDIFNFWIGYKSSKLLGKYSSIPIQCFGSLSMTFKELSSDDIKIYWKRNILLNLDVERKVKDSTAISLLFEEAVQNFTAKSLYPCDTKDVVLLSSVLLHLHLPRPTETPMKSNRRTLSLGRINRPLSQIFSSNPDVSSENTFSSMNALKQSTFSISRTMENRSSDNLSVTEAKRHWGKQFLSNEKNIALIIPKKKVKMLRLNYAEDILNQFMYSPFSLNSCTIQDIKFRFLTLCWNLTLYGCAYFDAEIKLQITIPFISCILAINDMGIYILHSKTKALIQNFKYSSISWNNNVESKCLILVTKKNNIYIKSKYNKIIAQLMLYLYAMNPA